MHYIELNYDEFNRLFSMNNLFSRGNEGLLFNYDDNTLVKIHSYLFNNIMNWNIYFNNSMLIEQVEKYVDKQKYIRYTDLPFGIVNYDNCAIASLNKKYYDCVRIDQYINKLSIIDALNMIKNFYITNNELLDNGIFHSDLSNNIFIDRDKTVRIVDFDSYYVFVDKEFDFNYVKYTYYRILSDYVSKNKTINSLDKSLILEDLGDIYSYLDFIPYINGLQRTKILKK